jgi:hypothetical protein
MLDYARPSGACSYARRCPRNRARAACVNLTQVCVYQAEGFLNEVVELVDRYPRVDADDGEELFEARRKERLGGVTCNLSISRSIHRQPG